MSQQTDIKALLHKYVMNRCTPAEAAQVVAYYQQNRLTNDFPSVDEIKFLIEQQPEVQTPPDAMFSLIMQQARKQEEMVHIPGKTRVRRLHWKRYAGIAASFAVFLTLGWIYFNNSATIIKAPVKLTGTEITLTNEKGEVQIINEKGEVFIKDEKGKIVASQQNNTIAYDNNADIEKLVYNTLNIPYGKRFQLHLSDGTVVHLNAGTTLKYPVKFIAGQDRTVYLDGEAFFDVAKDRKHPFIVNADKLNVRVLGTHFNVSSYPEDSHADVVLVEGSVGMYTEGQIFDASKNIVLEPGYKGSFNKAESNIQTKEVSTAIYTAWIKGELVFRNMAFKNICKKLERHYNIVIENHNTSLEGERFNASFKNEPVANVLSYFKELHNFNYTINKNKVIIK